ncbi:hypothetical protein ACFLT7_05075 [candidate division KSB1 bacterium]
MNARRVILRLSPAFLLTASLALSPGCMKRVPVSRDLLATKEIGKVVYVTTVDRREFAVRVTAADTSGVSGRIKDIRYRGEKMDRGEFGDDFTADYSEIIDIEKSVANRRTIVYTVVGLTMVTGVIWFVFGMW